MRKAKKLLVTLLVLTFVMSTFSVGFAATTADTKDLPTEVVRAMALGYLKGDAQGNLNLDKPITRAEALAIIIRVSGLETSAELMKGQTKFADVNPDPSLQWATGYINLGVGQKIINGYPDGTFRGNANVTYAEMAKMILYAMNYGVTVEGAPWPAGVMGKADDLGLFDKVSSAPDAPAIRGDVVKMIDNSLTIKHLEQTGYGDLKQYVEGDKTFLSKMDVDELEDVRVTEIARVNDKLDDDEIELTEYDKNGKKEDSNIYTLIADVNPEAIFGLKVDAWVNDDDEVFFVDVATDEKDILLDTVDESDKKEITLKDVDKTYKWIEDTEPIVYLNFAGVALDKIPEDAYGKVVLERGRVAFANLFEFEKVGVVTKVDGKVIEFINIDTDEDELDLSDYDDVYIYNPDFSKADAKDIKEDSAIFFWEGDDDDVYIIVKNETVKGKVDSVKEDKIKVDGKEYKRGSFKDTKALITLDKGDNYENWKDLEAVEDFVDEDVMLVLDLRGRVLLVTGAAKATSGNLYGIVTYTKSGRYPTLTVFNKEGKEVDYVAESSKEFDDLTSLKYNAVPPEYAALKYKLTSDSEIAEEKSVYAAIDKTGIKSSKSYDSDVKDYEVIFEGKLTKGTDKKFIKLDDNKTFYITNDTVIMKALNKDGELDPELISVNRFVSIGISNYNEAVVFGEKGKDADFIVMLNKNFEGTEEDYFYGVVTDKPYKSGGSYYATINVFGEGEKDYKIDDPDDFQEGMVVGFNLNSKDEAVAKKNPVTASIDGYKDGYLETSKGTFKVDSAAVLYSLEKDGDIDKKITRTKLGDYETIKYVLDDNNTIVAATVSKEVTDPDTDDSKITGVVTYITAANIAIDNVVYTFDANSVLYNTAGTVVATGGSNIIVLLSQNDIVEEVNIVNGVVRSLKLKVDASAKAAEVLAMPLTTDAEVAAARAAYNALPASVKLEANAITALGNIETAEAGIVDALITALAISNPAAPTAAEITAVEEARAAYEALSANAKTSVTGLATLEGHEATIEAVEVVSMINDLPATITLDDKADVVAARAAYDALSAAGKAKVTNVATLVSAEGDITTLEGYVADVNDAKTALSTLAFDPANGANDLTTIKLVLPQWTGTYANVELTAVASATTPAGKTVVVSDSTALADGSVTITRDAAEAFTFELTVTITSSSDATIKTDKVFVVTVPTGATAVTITAQ